MSDRGDLIGDAVADALNSPPLDVTTGTLDERKHRIWRAICNALDPYYEQHWVDFYDDPTVNPHYITGSTPYPMQSIAWQLTPTTEVPVAIWIKNGDGLNDWSRMWPSTGGGSVTSSGLVWRTAYECNFAALDPMDFDDDGWYDIGDGAGSVWGLMNYDNAQVSQITAGEGIQLQPNKATYDAGTLLSAPALSAYIDRLTDVFAPDSYSQLDMWIWVRATWDSFQSGSYDRIIVGFVYSATVTGAIYPLLNWRCRQFSGYNNTATFEQHMQHNTSPNNGTESWHSWNHDESPQHDVFVFHVRPGYQVDNYFGDSVDGAFPARSALTFAGSSILQSGVDLAGGMISTAFYPTIYFACAGNGNVGPITVHRMRIDYLGVDETTIGTGGAGFTDVAIADGEITGFGAYRNLRATGAGPLVGIQNTGFADGEPMSITFVAETEVTGLGATGLVPIRGPYSEGSYLDSFTIPAGEELQLKYIANSGGTPYFRYTGGSVV